MAATTERASLLDWPQQHEIDAIDERRTNLLNRISRLARNSHRRIVLEAQLRDLTAQQLKLENELSVGAL